MNFVTAQSESFATTTWDTIVEWMGKASGPALKVALIIAGAFVVWALGRLAIKEVTDGIRDHVTSLDRRERRRLRLMRKQMPAVSEQSADERLEQERDAQRAKTVSMVLRSALGVTVGLITVVMVLTELGVPVAPILASAGIVGVALGFGAQSLVKDLLSGIFMLIEDQYGIGDTVDLGHAVGGVEEVGLRTTRLRSLDGTVWYIPNGEIQRVGNRSRLWSRALVEVRIDYDADIDEARKALTDAANIAVNREDIIGAVLDTPDIPGLESLAGDAVLMRVLVRVEPNEQWNVQRAIRDEIRNVFKARGIALALPESRVHVAPKSSLKKIARDTAAPEDSETSSDGSETSSDDSSTSAMPEK